MKKRKIIFLVVSLVFISSSLGCFIGVSLISTHSKTDNKTESVKKIKSSRSLSMMLETGASTGVYEQTTRSTWPTEGYKFNEELSKCENGGKLSWNDENNTVVMTGSTSDKCYVYFDKVVYLADYVKNQYTGIQGANSLYLHNSSLANGAGDNSYRYAGSCESVNNYVCFGSTATPCPNDNLYRIIGVFGDQVKLIKADYATSAQLGSTGAFHNTYSNIHGLSSYYKGSNYSNIAAYYWTSSDNTSNVWSGSALNTTNLNGTYLTNLGTWANKIATTTWKVGGNTWANIGTSPMNTAYQNEIVSPAASTTYPAQIGLMYISDYGYAASPTYWTYKGYDTATTDYRAAVNDNWMYMGLYEWTISRSSDTSNIAFRVDDSGDLNNYYSYVNYGGIAVRPVFYLTSNVQYDKGSGTISDPILIK